jgi:hypothetical protein
VFCCVYWVRSSSSQLTPEQAYEAEREKYAPSDDSLAKQIRVLEVDAIAEPQRMQGTCTARFEIETKLRKHEKWTAMVDAGTTFVQGWDDCCLAASSTMPSSAVLSGVPLPGKPLAEQRELLNEGPTLGAYTTIGGYQSGVGIAPSDCLPALGMRLFVQPLPDDVKCLPSVPWCRSFSFARTAVHNKCPYKPWAWASRLEEAIMLARFRAAGVTVHVPSFMPCYGAVNLDQVDAAIDEIMEQAAQCTPGRESRVADAVRRFSHELHKADAPGSGPRATTRCSSEDADDVEYPDMLADVVPTGVTPEELRDVLSKTGILPGFGPIDAALAIGYTLDDGKEGVLKQIVWKHASRGAFLREAKDVAMLPHAKQTMLLQ